jgi:copper homeostasis protein
VAVLTEVCVDSAVGARAAWTGGADRIELCTALETGGLTPSRGLQEVVLGVAELPVHVLIRPRQGDFCYDQGEIAAMVVDIGEALAAGAASVVVGALTADGRVDTEVVRRFIDAAGGAPVTFNRAFDLIEDQVEALDALLELGVSRVLTSGGRRTAAEGAGRLAELVQRGGDAITVLAGAGINPVNAAAVVRTSGVHEIHFSARQSMPTPLRFRNPDVVLGAGEVKLGRTSAGAVAATVAAVREL